MGLALDEPDSFDEIFHENGFDIIVREKELLEMIHEKNGIRVHVTPNRWVGSEFRITPR